MTKTFSYYKVEGPRKKRYTNSHVKERSDRATASLANLDRPHERHLYRPNSNSATPTGIEGSTSVTLPCSAPSRLRHLYRPNPNSATPTGIEGSTSVTLPCSAPSRWRHLYRPNPNSATPTGIEGSTSATYLIQHHPCGAIYDHQLSAGRLLVSVRL